MDLVDYSPHGCIMQLMVLLFISGVTFGLGGALVACSLEYSLLMVSLAYIIIGDLGVMLAALIIYLKHDNTPSN